jgi:nucleoside-diphosphate-sugar epimerase
MPPPIQTIEQLETWLSEPTDGLVETMKRVPGDIIFLGVGGKMGPTMARMAKRASDLVGTSRRIIGVSRFSSGAQEADMNAHGIETIRCDLLDEAAVRALPEAPNVVYLAGVKFGSTGQEPLTWALNTFLPSVVCKKFSRSKIVALSTGNVYGLAPASGQGSAETDPLNPVGEYAMSCLGRERMFEYFSRALKLPVALLRLNYACELRYGVLVDLAQATSIDLGMGWLNTIWQGDANAMVLQCLNHVSSPPFVINITGPERLSVRQTCERFTEKLKRPVSFSGREAENALLSNAQKAFDHFGKPRVSADELIDWIADWISRGGATLRKPTKFESRDGKF